MKDTALTIRLPSALAAEFSAACRAADMSQSQVLRAAIRSFVRSNPAPAANEGV